MISLPDTPPDEPGGGAEVTPLRAVAGRGDPPAGHHALRPAPEPEVLTLEEAAQLLRVPADFLRARAEAGEVPGRRLGDEWHFRREALLAWLGAVS
ncbi:MAG: helix-turn-helix domain-containing protein [Solirubrobacteraceae bacterium]|nr:helix-turn-helix domain-containing protein [Solirubrobacteraceae bacterium]